MKTVRDVTWNGARDLPPMEDRFEQSAVNACRYLLNKHCSNVPKAIKGIDPEEIRRITHNMRRETWQPPGRGYTAGTIAEMYIRQWRSVKASELSHLGVSGYVMSAAAKRLGCEIIEIRSGKVNETFYSLPKH